MPARVNEGPWAARRSRALWGAVWLVFMVYPVVDLVRAHPSAWRLALGAGGAVAFSAAYLGLCLDAPVPRRRVVAAEVAGLAGLGLGLELVFGTAWLGVGFYIVMAGALLLEARLAVVSTLLLVAAEGFLFHLQGLDLESASSLLLAYALLGLVGVGIRRMIAVIGELHYAREELARLAVEEERARFARDLHDLLGHSLSVVALKSELAGRLLASAPDRAAAELRDIERVSREALREVREAVQGSRRPRLAEELAGARRALEAAGIALSLEEAAEPVPQTAEPVLAWTIREGATNVIRHSRASSCRIRIFSLAGMAGVEIVDDGSGPAPAGAEGTGLSGLAERIRPRGGSVEAGAGPEGGFRLRVTVAPA
ncbi:MAG: sensor histidine kinase [Candidatus Dormibacterales bacterium]